MDGCSRKKGFSEKHQCEQNQADVTKEDVGHNRRKSVTMVTLYQSNGLKPPKDADIDTMSATFLLLKSAQK